MKIRLLLILLLTHFTIFSQIDFKYGVKGSYQLNSAILPDIELNESIEDVLNGEDVAKGVPQYADITSGYRIGVFGELHDKIGFTQISTEYISTHIYKEVKLYEGFFGNYSIKALDRNYTYVDLSASYNIYLNQNRNLYFGLGAGLNFLTSYTGDEEPEKANSIAFVNIGVDLNENIGIEAKGLLTINEVYKDSYIHHLMFPVSLKVRF